MDKPPEDLSRRDLIKRGAAAGGLVWAAPVVLSLRARDAAAGTPAPTTSETTSETAAPGPVPGPTPNGQTCNQGNSFKFCGDVITDCGLDGQCSCIQTTEGDFACAGDLDDLCSNPGPPLCTSSDQCPPNEPICITVDNCCGDGFGRCVKPCSAWKKHKKHARTGVTPLG